MDPGSPRENQGDPCQVNGFHGRLCLASQSIQHIKLRLSTYPTFDVSQRAFALQLGGHNPKDLFRDPVVWGINKAYFGAIGGPEGFTADGVGEVLQHMDLSRGPAPPSCSGDSS